MTELEALLLIILSIYALVIFFGIHYYEDKMKKLKEQLVNLTSNKTIVEVDLENQVLKEQIKMLKLEKAGDQRTIQYESSIYKNTLWETKDRDPNEDLS